MPTEDDFRCLFYRLIYISNGTGSDEYLDTWQFQAPKCHWKLTSIGSSLQNWALFHHWESFSTNSNDGKDVQISIYRGSPFILVCDLQIRKSRIQGTHLTPAWMLVLTSLIPPVMHTFTMALIHFDCHVVTFLHSSTSIISSDADEVCCQYHFCRGLWKSTGMLL